MGILLSARAQRKLLSFDSEGERVCYVRLKGPICNLSIIAVYMPHRGRVAPSQDDTIKDLETVLAKVPRGDCVCVLGDLNEQLEGGIKDRTGKWTAGPKSLNSDKIIQLMRLHELTAANTLFEPRHKNALQTFLQTKRAGHEAHNDYGEYVGAEVRVNYKGERIEGKVLACSPDHPQHWVVKFNDGYVCKLTRKKLEHILIRTKKEKIGRQLDYILISTRWKSCVVSCSPRWGPAIRRDVHGEKNDHALVECVFKWRLRSVKQKTCKDFQSLRTQDTLDKFDSAVIAKKSELQFDATKDSTTQLYDKLCKAIQHAVETVLPKRIKRNGVKREVSEKTRALFDERTNLRGRGTQEQYGNLQRRIKKSSLADFETWVNKWAQKISDAESVGDTKRIYEGVNVLAQKSERPSPNLTTDHNGVTLTCAEDVARAWQRFLTAKFSATEAERGRPTMESCHAQRAPSLLPMTNFCVGYQKWRQAKHVDRTAYLQKCIN